MIIPVGGSVCLSICLSLSPLPFNSPSRFFPPLSSSPSPCPWVSYPFLLLSFPCPSLLLCCPLSPPTPQFKRRGHCLPGSCLSGMILNSDPSIDHILTTHRPQTHSQKGHVCPHKSPFHCGHCWSIYHFFPVTYLKPIGRYSSFGKKVNAFANAKMSDDYKDLSSQSIEQWSGFSHELDRNRILFNSPTLDGSWHFYHVVWSGKKQSVSWTTAASNFH